MRHVCHAVDKMGDTTETVCGRGGAGTTHIPSQHARVSLVGKKLRHLASLMLTCMQPYIMY